MSSPTPAERQAMLDALISNGLSFLEKSATELAQEPQFSVVHFATGMELILKARLFSEHWSLVSATPTATRWSEVMSGSMLSIQANKLGSAISSITGEPFKIESEVLDRIFSHRNRVVHFVPSPTVGEVAAEQFRVWFYMHRHLVTTWQPVFGPHAARIQKLDHELRSHRACLQVRFDELTKSSRFKGPEAAGALVVCPVCSFRSATLGDPDAHLTDLACPVCASELEVANFGCGNWHSFADGFYGELRCGCGAVHRAKDLAGLMDNSPPMSPKEQAMTGSTQYSCGECLTYESVVSTDGGLRCYACGARFDDADLENCEWCQETWVGYDCSDTAWFGCEFCDGQAGNVKDD